MKLDRSEIRYYNKTMVHKTKNRFDLDFYYTKNLCGGSLFCFIRAKVK